MSGNESRFGVTVEELRSAAPGLDDDDAALRRLILHSERAIIYAARRARFATTPDGRPADESIAAAFRDAVRAQAATVATSGMTAHVFTGGAGMDAPVRATSDNGASVEFDRGAINAATSRLLSGGLAPEARLILEQAGLLSQPPIITY